MTTSERIRAAREEGPSSNPTVTHYAVANAVTLKQYGQTITLTDDQTRWLAKELAPYAA